jgi:hypothetical protein
MPSCRTYTRPELPRALRDNRRGFGAHVERRVCRIRPRYRPADHASEAKDSKFQNFAPVTYQEKRPPVFAKILDFAAETMFGDQFERARAALKGIIYAKTNDYNFEGEYRLAIPLGEGEEDYRVLAYHPEEISELYLGAAMKETDKREIIATAKALNPAIAVFPSRTREGGSASTGSIRQRGPTASVCSFP